MTRSDDISSMGSAVEHSAEAVEASSLVAAGRVSWLPHVWVLLAAAMVLLMSRLMSCEGPDEVFLPGTNWALPPMCASRLVWGFECPGCGLTRGFISIADGKWSEAWKYNPASFALFAMIAVQLPWQSWQLFRLAIGKTVYQPKWIYLVPIFAAIATIGQWIIRMTGLF